MSEKLTNEFNEPLVMPPNFQHPNWGKYKDQPEEFFHGAIVRIYVETDVGAGEPGKIPVWLDVVRFEDKVVDGTPVRLGIGRVQRTICPEVPAGLEVLFHPAMVFDVVKDAKCPREPGGVEVTLATAE